MSSPNVTNENAEFMKTCRRLQKQEHRRAVRIGEQLARVRNLLLELEADDKMLHAVDQAITDNEQWMDPSSSS
jgi:hypothetical protein